jgi:2-oxoglutarate/2-oxoacid ferredoxin oxidoreductase subunit alpha
MSQIAPVLDRGMPPLALKPIVNDLCITFSTVNGSGSATANSMLLRGLFRMGIPVSGKNIFPSNIQGLPTWYTLRVNKNGFLGRSEKDDIVVAMNASTIAKEQDFLVPGGVLFYADDIKLPNERDDIIIYPMPIKKLIKESEVSNRLRDYIANMVYVGILAQMLGIDLSKIYDALDFQFKGKKVAVDANYKVISDAAAWTVNNLPKRDRYFVETMNATDGLIMADGNTSGALGSLYGGVQFVAWYPITPASSLAESLSEYIPMLRRDLETGRDTCAVVQAEDELAAVGMTVGAGWAGLRSMTSTSGPGLSLMAEYMGLAYFSETPLVVWDVQRVGPSTGLPTRTAQGDLTFGYFLSHGDTQFPMLIPGDVNECFEFGWRSFDIAERLQTPVIIMSDLDLGMNQWMSKPFEYPDTPMDRGKVLWEDDLEALLAKLNDDWGRYLDVDGDGVPYRTLPGNKHPRAAFFTRGTGHDEFAKYSEDPTMWEKGMDRLKRKFYLAKQLVPEPVIDRMEGAKVGIIACGSTELAIKEARWILDKAGIQTNFLRVRALPFNDDVADFIRHHERNYVVEINRDGQLKQLLALEFCDLTGNLISISHLDGLPLTAGWITEQISSREANQQ